MIYYTLPSNGCLDELYPLNQTWLSILSLFCTNLEAKGSTLSISINCTINSEYINSFLERNLIKKQAKHQMTSMDVIQVFNDELQSLHDIKPPVSKAKMGLITRAAMKGVKFYKHIVQSVEKFIAKCKPEYKVPGLYVIDSIVRQSRHQFGVERDVYAARFSRNLQMTFNNLFSGCSIDDKPKIVRVLNLWQKNGVFSSQTIQPLLDMAIPNSSLSLTNEITPSAESPQSGELKKQGHSSKYLLNHFGSSNSNSQVTKSSSSSGKHSRGSEGTGLRFSKNMLDFDYDEEDDDDGDETPTEAEPPLSSTLNKIEMEQRNRNDLPSPANHPSNYTQLHSQPMQAPISNQTSSSRLDQDPVLERWNRLIKQQSITNENSSDQTVVESSIRNQRHRSRSPVTRERLPAPTKEVPPTRARSPKANSAEKDAERQAERLRKCLPKIRDKHLTVCSSTLWLGHVPKTVSEADISDAFGEYGTINSIDLIPPRGCAYVCMDRRQDAKRALTESRNLKLNGSHIKMAWAPGKGFKEFKRLKEFWEVDTGSSYIPYNKIDSSIDFDVLEEGGVIDEDSMSMEMRETRERKRKEKENLSKGLQPALNLPLPTLPILTQPPPTFAMPPPNLSIPPPSTLNQGAGLGGIPYPPPNVTSVNNQMTQPNANIFDNQDPQEKRDLTDGFHSPTSLDQQLSMTERQINMVEQQLSLIQQAQNMSQHQQSMPPPPPQMHAPQMFHPGQPNPMIFDLHQTQMLHPQMLDQQLHMFTNPPSMIGQPPPMLPINQANLNHNADVNSMPHYGNRY